MSLDYFTDAFLSKLRGAVPTNLQKYSQQDDWLAAFAGTGEYAKSTGLTIPELPALAESEEGSKNDADNAQRIYLPLQSLNPTQACDERLWAYLSHVTYRSYMMSRWEATNAEVVLERYFIKGKGLSSLSGNGMARLWWGAFLTFDKNRTDPFELTRVLFKNQDIQQGVMERSLGKNRAVVAAVLDFVKNNEPLVSLHGGLGGGFKRMIKRLNFEGGVRLLDSMSAEGVAAILRDELS